MNCAIVSLQLMRLVTGIQSNSVIPYYPGGLLPKEFLEYTKTFFGLDLTFYPFSVDDFKADKLNAYMIPGFACMVIVSSREFRHTVVYFSDPLDGPILIDPQTGHIYSNKYVQPSEKDREYFKANRIPYVRNLASIIDHWKIIDIQVVVYADGIRKTIEDHKRISNDTDRILSNQAFRTFFDRGFIFDRKYDFERPPLPLPSAATAATAGEKRVRTIELRSKTIKKGRMESDRTYGSSRTSKLTR